jgi:hypothetical protein
MLSRAWGSLKNRYRLATGKEGKCTFDPPTEEKLINKIAQGYTSALHYIKEKAKCVDPPDQYVIAKNAYLARVDVQNFINTQANKKTRKSYTEKNMRRGEVDNSQRFTNKNFGVMTFLNEVGRKALCAAKVRAELLSANKEYQESSVQSWTKSIDNCNYNYDELEALHNKFNEIYGNTDQSKPQVRIQLETLIEKVNLLMTEYKFSESDSTGDMTSITKVEDGTPSTEPLVREKFYLAVPKDFYNSNFKDEAAMQNNIKCVRYIGTVQNANYVAFGSNDKRTYTFAGREIKPVGETMSKDETVYMLCNSLTITSDELMIDNEKYNVLQHQGQDWTPGCARNLLGFIRTLMPENFKILKSTMVSLIQPQRVKMDARMWRENSSFRKTSRLRAATDELQKAQEEKGKQEQRAAQAKTQVELQAAQANLIAAQEKATEAQNALSAAKATEAQNALSALAGLQPEAQRTGSPDPSVTTANQEEYEFFESREDDNKKGHEDENKKGGRRRSLRRFKTRRYNGRRRPGSRRRR